MIAVDAYDAAGNRSGRASITGVDQPVPAAARTPPPSDTTAPSVPTGLTVTGATVVEHLAALERLDGQHRRRRLRALSRRSRRRLGVADECHLLRASRAAGAISSRSMRSTAAGIARSRGSVVASTAPCPDTTAPSTPSALTQTGVTETTVGLGWAASSDNVGVAGYGVYLGGVRIASTSSRATRSAH